MTLFNSRNDIRFYEVAVYDKDFLPVPFATADRIFELSYLSRKSVDVFIRDADVSKAVYICSRSKILARGSAITSISSRICSKIK
jgi:ABC-type lipopolysaccharide export system ATPase subunit